MEWNGLEWRCSEEGRMKLDLTYLNLRIELLQHVTSLTCA
jgi:hypothetical protein